MFDSLLHLRSCGLAFRRQTISLVDITRSAKRSWTWSLTGRLRHLAYLVCSLGAVHFALLGTIHRVHPRTDVSSYGLPACLPGTSCQSLNLHSCVYHRASESGSASWPTTAAGQKNPSSFWHHMQSHSADVSLEFPCKQHCRRIHPGTGLQGFCVYNVLRSNTLDAVVNIR